jgi:SAM-dependent methyltransferase
MSFSPPDMEEYVMPNWIRVRESARNVGHFVTRVPVALERRRVGSAYIKKHPEMERIYERPNTESVIAEIRRLAPDLSIETMAVSREYYDRWVRREEYPLLAYHVSREEKFLEHAVSVDLLGDRSGLLIDVASCRSYFPYLMRRRGFRVIVQDLAYTEGLHGDVLGCNAASFPLPDASIDAMTLHCSFEHFEGDADQGFVREASRLLTPGGRAVIIPLYLHERQITWVDPYFLSIGEVIEEPGAEWQPAIGYGNRFGRMYSARTFVDRILSAVEQTELKPTLWYIEGATDVAPSCYLQFALTLEKAPREN